jgi:predicted DNA-binding WGR domain protein
MKLIQQTCLWYSEGNSDKIYEVDLCEVGNNQFVVNFRYGRRGASLRDGTKTTLPVGQAEARKIFDQLVSSKTREGYQEVNLAASGATPPVAPSLTVSIAKPADKPAFVLSQLQHFLQTGKSDKWPINRIIWRIGELRIREAVPQLMGMLPKSDHLQQYCIAWALGRCGDGQAVATLKRLYEAPASTQMVRRISLLSLLTLTTERSVWLKPLVESLPSPLQHELSNGTAESLMKWTEDPAHQKIMQIHVETLYLLVPDHPKLHAAILHWLGKVPLQPNYFKPIRHLFKLAEFREDALVFGMIAYRLEKTNALFRFQYWGDYASYDGQWFQDARKELGKKDSRLAYSNRTRIYLRQRVWRTLRTLGKDNPSAYTDMALGVLLPFSDQNDRLEPRIIHEETYNWQTRSTTVREIHYDPYAPYWAFNQILYRHSTRYESKRNTLTWQCRPAYQSGSPAPTEREEAFPECWDRHPEKLMHLLAQSQCEAVHEFALKALRTNDRLASLINAKWLIQLLNQPYANTVRFSLEWLPRFYNPAQPDAQLVRTLVRHPLPEARLLAMQWITTNTEYFQKKTLLFADLIMSPYPDVQKWTGELLHQFPIAAENAELLVAKVIAELLGMKGEGISLDQAAVTSASQLMATHFAQAMATINLEVVRDLLRHPWPSVQLLGAQALLNHQVSATQLPQELIEGLIGASTPEVRQAGVQLFGRLPGDTLLARQEVLLAFAASPHVEIREAVGPIIRSMAIRYAHFGEEFLKKLLPFMLRKEPYDGLKEGILQLIESELKRYLPAIDQETALQLLHSSQAPNQKLGNLLLRECMADATLSLREVVKLANHEMQEVRQRAWQFYRDNLSRVRSQAEEALRILDANWEDSRRFAFDFFRQQFTENDWTPSLLVSVCDSTREDVQQFGREMITRFFKAENGPDYLLQLSQHPSQALQLFATHYLEQFATDQPDRLKALESYFTTVLSQVNRAGIAKIRIFSFLHREALKNEAVAQWVTALMARQSLTMAVADKAACLKIMRDLQKNYPQLSSPLTIRPVAAYEKQ